MWKIDHDGAVQWRNALDATVNPSEVRITSIEETTGGDLLATVKDYDNASLMRFSDAGTLQEALYAPAATDIPMVAGIGQDSLSFVYTALTNNGNPTVAHATDLSNATCALSPATVIGNISTPSYNITPDPVPAYSTDPISTWDLSIGPLADLTGIDLRAYVGMGCARPGFRHSTWATVHNFGGDASGAVEVTMTLDPSLVLLSFYPPNPVSTAGNVVTWNLPSMEAFGTYEFWIHDSVPVPMPLGYDLAATFNVDQPLPETDLGNNTAVANEVVSGSYDPNDKLVRPRDFYHIDNDTVLDYTIRFQNTGTDTAFTVVVVDTLPLSVDTRTFEMGTSSHSCEWSLTGNGILTLTFAQILLPDSNTNEPLSHGLANFRIRPLLPLTLGQEITNRADIYFDFNEPIRTPDATVIVTDETGVRPLVRPEGLTVFPVPVKNILTAVLPTGFSPVSAVAIGVDGRHIRLTAHEVVAQQTGYGTEHLPPGAYVLTLHDREGRRLSARFTKE